MSRIRTIKPEFFTSESIVFLSPLARLLYVALWCEADRDGRLKWKVGSIKMRYFPAESCDIKQVCDELVAAGLVVPYEVDGSFFAVIPTFRKHQAINVRESKSVIPPPPDDVHVQARAKDSWLVDKQTRETVMARDGEKCVRCNSQEFLQIDHIFPKSIGGTNALTNLRVLCRSCNAGRPVAGKGLIKDLARDGLTLDDMHRTCMHVQDDGERKGREGKGDSFDLLPESQPVVPEASNIKIPLNDGSEYSVLLTDIAEWKAAYQAVDVEGELRQMRTWAMANPTRKKTARGVAAFIVKWLAKAQDNPGASKRFNGHAGDDQSPHGHFV